MNDNSLLRTFFQVLYDCMRLLYIYIIFMLYFFVYDLYTLFKGKTTNQTNAQANQKQHIQIIDLEKINLQVVKCSFA